MVYSRSESDWSKERKTRGGHLWAVSTRGDAPPVQLTQGKGESGALWAPDSSAIAFTANRDGDSGSQIYILPAPGTLPRSRYSWGLVSTTYALSSCSGSGARRIEKPPGDNGEVWNCMV